MGTFHVNCQVENHVRGSQAARVSRIPVDTGSEHTWISETALKKIAIRPEKRDVAFRMANGQTVTRDIGFAVIRIGEAFTIDEVVFARRGDLQLLGARTLEGLNLTVNAREKKLVAAGPILAA